MGVVVSGHKRFSDPLLYPAAKRFFDFCAALTVLILFLPLLVVISIAVKVTSPGPIIFKGIRVGQHGKLFNILKFRTMQVGAQTGSATTSRNDPRITKAGHFLRKYKLDELPQILNVMGGGMSVVGPRPEIPSFVDKYNQEEREILSVKPGITDLASLYFRDMGELIDDSDPATSYMKNVWKKKNSLRLEYVHKQSFILDMKILFSTLSAILVRR
jgi:lipopolysaccharide/colanic/teichoic acid biosynthesis glycosyltransferase